MALVVLSVVEQRLDAVRTVLAGADVVTVAASVGVSRLTVHPTPDHGRPAARRYP